MRLLLIAYEHGDTARTSHNTALLDGLNSAIIHLEARSVLFARILAEDKTSRMSP